MSRIRHGNDSTAFDGTTTDAREHASGGKSGASSLLAGRELEGLASLVRSFTVEIQSRGRGGRTGQGSGVVWHSDGLIVTNAHVARERKLAVAFGETLVEAECVARDERRDLALVHVGAEGLVAATAGDANLVKAGSLVMALGHPLGVQNAMSLGVVHAVTHEHGHPRFIAADVALAPGNSGGPLVDVNGRVIGINAMVMGGLGVAIASNVVRRFVGEVVASGAVSIAHPLAA